MYALIINQQVDKYPYSVDQLKKDNPQISFPKTPSDELLASFNVFPVALTKQPAYDPATQRFEEGLPVLVTGKWTQTWNVVSLTAEEANQYLEDLKSLIVEQTQQRLDNFARTRGYGNMLSACTYANDVNQVFASEGKYCIQARGLTWAKLYNLLDEIKSGSHSVPNSFSDIESELPILMWPKSV